MVLLIAGYVAIRKVGMNSGDIFQNNCPHCQTRSVAFAIEYVRGWWYYLDGDEFEPVRREDTLAVCGFCNKTVLAEFGEEGNFLRVHPSPPEPPENLPETVGRYFEQGVDSLFQNYDAAGAMFRTTLETALKIKFPKTKAINLKDRINKAVEQGNLTSDLAAWAHEIRLGGNDAVHEEPLSEEEAQDLCDFTELVLLYLFTLPEKLARARARREPDIPPPPYEDEIPF